MSLYVLSTWFFANILYPVILFFYWGGKLNSMLSVLSGYISLLFFSLLLSLPALLLSIWVVKIIIRIVINSEIKFALWLILAPFIVMANYFIISYGISRENIYINDGEWTIIIPAMIAVMIIVLVRYKFFYTSLNALQSKKQEEGELL